MNIITYHLLTVDPLNHVDWFNCFQLCIINKLLYYCLFVGPGSAKFKSCANMSSTSIQLAWDPPSDPNGIVTNYRVNWTFQETYSTNLSKKGSKELSYNELQKDIEGLGMTIITS